MTRIFAVLALVASLLVAPHAAAATTAPTITGPATARFWSTVTVHGQTPAPNQGVVVYTRPINQQVAHKSQVLTSRPDGAYSWSFRIGRMTHFWAHAGGLNSPVHTTVLVQASCTISGAAFHSLPFPLLPEPIDTQSTFAAFTANRSGVWAGFAHDGFGDFAVIRWTYGWPLQVLDRFTYDDGPYDPNYHGSIDLAGITPHGNVVARVQDPAAHSRRNPAVFGLYWDHGARHQLHSKSTWTAAWPVRVLEDGTIIGLARRMDGLFMLVSWATVNSPVRDLMHFGHRFPGVAVDRVGDVVWSRDGGDRVRLRSGAVRLLGTPADDTASPTPTAGGRYSVYASGTSGVLQWDLLHVPASGPIPASYRTGFDGGNAWVTAAGVHGDAVVGMNYTQHLLTATGAWVTMPKEPDTTDYPGQSFDERGGVAFTSLQDGLPHFLRCH